jgi:hypothetical protein
VAVTDDVSLSLQAERRVHTCSDADVQGAEPGGGDLADVDPATCWVKMLVCVIIN